MSTLRQQELKWDWSVVLIVFIFLPIFITLVVQFVGYDYALITQTIIMLVILAYVSFVLKFNGVGELFFVLILLGCLFDSEPFLISSLKIRLWYFIYFVGLVFSIYSFLKRKVNVLGFLIFVYMCCVGIVDLFLTDGGLFAIKYIFFYVLVVYFVSNSIFLSRYSLSYFFNIISIVCIPFVVFGVIQFVFSISMGFQNNPLLPPVYNLEPRPVAFFSETTWLSELSLFILISLLVIKNVAFKALGLFFTLIIIVITVTRNTYLALSICIFLFIILECLRFKFNKNALKMSIASILIFSLIALMNDKVFDLLLALVNRFTDLETGGGGRLEAFVLAWSMFIENPSGWLGNGFSWHEGIVAGQGSSLGAKAFNSIIMFNHIFGLLFTLMILLYVLVFVIKSVSIILDEKSNVDSRAISYALLFYLISFISISMFAPIHQYPLGAVILGIAFGGINKVSVSKL